MRRKTLLVSVLVLLMLFAAAPLMSLAAKAEGNAVKSEVETTNVQMARADAGTEGPQPQAIWGSQKKWASQFWYAYGQAYNSATWPGQGILFSSGFQVDSYAYYSFTLPAPPWDISYLDVGIYGKAVSGNGLDVYVWNWASSSWDFVATTPTVEGHKYWGVSPTNHVQGSSYEYRLRVYADDYLGNDDRYDMWYIDTYYYYTPKPYDVSIWSFLMNEGWIGGVPITMDGVPTGYTTGHTFTGLVGSHTFTVPSYYAPYNADFTDWNPSGIKSTTITITSGGTWTARYTRRTTYSATISAYCYTEGAYISVPITKDGSPSGWSTAHTFAGLIGTHTFTVPNTDAMGHPFIKWLSGSTSTTITVSSAGTYYALYQKTAVLATVLTLSLSPNPANPGQTVTLSGTLKTVSGMAPVYPATVKVEYSTNGGASWNFFTNLNTNAAGQFSTSFGAPGVGTYLVRASYAGSAAYGSSSNTQTFTVQTGGKVNTVIVFSFSPNPASPGQTVTLSGTLKTVTAIPVYPAQVKVEYSTNGGATWIFGWNLNTNAAGQFSVSFGAPGAGSYLARVSYAGSASYNPSSSTQTLTVS